jgi:hypothetical protein
VSSYNGFVGQEEIDGAGNGLISRTIGWLVQEHEDTLLLMRDHGRKVRLCAELLPSSPASTNRGKKTTLEHGDFSAAYIVNGCTDGQLLLLYQVG